MKNDELIHYINQNFQKDWLKIENEKLVLIYTGELKKFLDNKNIQSELDLHSNRNEKSFQRFIKSRITYVSNNEKLYPNSFGLTNAPLFIFNKINNKNKQIAVFAYMDYAVFDWVDYLKRYNEVKFSGFLNLLESV
ncbi:hypothetical protein A0M37_03335 [Campylobacter jejuni]|uniref:hypothetical protein n=1 Tax=Campylobacter TaxID=194 RepID=UPI000874603F|nr:MULTISPECIES: hypothetical protein [Campylobacter]ELP8609348.1 hypothetical protein [Campylobacter coli]EAJ1912837.1 hypothetical protein [Campylobacter jejuni]EAK2220472.1 hypothetical protein [Campylobacter jejuni]EAL8918219.1 hypothetical protein [Campylobacter jejuni]EDF9110102.1 hypothetical protein [Campylobacter jejuni]